MSLPLSNNFNIVSFPNNEVNIPTSELKNLNRLFFLFISNGILQSVTLNTGKATPASINQLNELEYLLYLHLFLSPKNYTF